MGTVKFNVIIPDYPEYYQMSNARKAKYFTRMDKLPAIYKDETKYAWVHFNKAVRGQTKGMTIEYLYDVVNKTRVVKNSKTAGKPRMNKIRGQLLWESGQGAEHAIRAMKEQLTAFFIPFITRQLQHKKIFAPVAHFIQLEFIFFYPLYEFRDVAQDIDNHALPYVKTFQDALILTGTIPGDEPTIIRGNYARYIAIEDAKERRMEVRFHFCKNLWPVYELPPGP